MIFTPENVQKILAGEKTETRRIVKAGETLFGSEVYTGKHLQKWGVGNTYALQPGRGKQAVGRIRIMGLRREALQAMTDADARAEGVADVAEFRALWDSINKRKGHTWEDNPMVWVIRFEVMA